MILYKREWAAYKRKYGVNRWTAWAATAEKHLQKYWLSMGDR